MRLGLLLMSIETLPVNRIGCAVVKSIVVFAGISPEPVKELCSFSSEGVLSSSWSLILAPQKRITAFTWNRKADDTVRAQHNGRCGLQLVKQFE